MKKGTVAVAAGAALIAAVGLAGMAAGQPYGSNWHGCPGMMGPGMMGPGMMGPGMMGGPGHHGWGNYQFPANPSVSDIKAYLERWVAAMGNPRLKVGTVKEKNADTIVGEIVTVDGSLVQRYEVDRQSGVYRPV